MTLILPLGECLEGLPGFHKLRDRETALPGDGLPERGDAALAAAQATAELLPRLGRARPHGERSLGHPDPGAMSLAYCLIAASQTTTSSDALHAER